MIIIIIKKYNIIVGKANYAVGISAFLEISLLIVHIGFVLDEIKIYYRKKELIKLKKDREKE